MQNNRKSNTPSIATGQSFHLTRHEENANDLYPAQDKGFACLPDTPGELHKSLKSVKVQPAARQRGKPSQTTWRFIVMTGDLILLMASFILVSMLAPYLHLEGEWSKYRFTELPWICLALLAWGVAVRVTQAQELFIAANRFKSPLSTLFALALTSLFWLTLTNSFFKDISLNELSFCFVALAAPVLCIWRVVLAEVISLPEFRRRAVIVGVNTATETLAREIRKANRPGITILGCISESSQELDQHNGLPIWYGREALRRLVQSNSIDMIIMALDYKAHPELFQEAINAAQHGISVVPMAMIYETTSGKVPVKHIGDQWYVTLPSEQTIPPLYLCWRKLLDLVVGFCGVVLLALLLPILSLLIVLDSRGPVFYSQDRLGLKGKSFRIYKFRSMRTDAESTGEAVWAKANDSRVTRVGRILRATHLDELPQAFNILRGDMSLLGPRPERAEFVSELEKTIPFYRYRLAVKPGLTGWAQVKYRYGNTDSDALIKLQYDLYYIKRQSFMLDIFIMLKTVVEVLFRRGV